jgi:hypothetical protein
MTSQKVPIPLLILTTGGPHTHVTINVLWKKHKMQEGWVLGTLYQVKSQNGSKDFHKSNFLIKFCKYAKQFLHFWEKSNEHALNFLSQIKALRKWRQIKSFYTFTQIIGWKLMIESYFINTKKETF